MVEIGLSRPSTACHKSLATNLTLSPGRPLTRSSTRRPRPPMAGINNPGSSSSLLTAISSPKSASSTRTRGSRLWAPRPHPMSRQSIAQHATWRTTCRWAPGHCSRPVTRGAHSAMGLIRRRNPHHPPYRPRRCRNCSRHWPGTALVAPLPLGPRSASEESGQRCLPWSVTVSALPTPVVRISSRERIMRAQSAPR